MTAKPGAAELAVDTVTAVGRANPAAVSGPTTDASQPRR
ncbi:hypothetical protein FB390_0198 [Nocardia bhagyanarayanae]|uniref:Uncharacterized protein n=1 Tax=Nocardia bhagyanarayanae TaxID=1215925 RepID=A0A543F471_9NOCA|nr:hypothetical protein FB390_0198 [Nocardia bhagyanarayanae]